MISEQEYLKALSVVNSYKRQQFAKNSMIQKYCTEDKHNAMRFLGGQKWCDDCQKTLIK